MVILARAGDQRRLALVSIELIIALGILMTTLLPLAYAFTQEQRLARAYYFRAIAMEIIDGEMEILAAGGWRAYPQGRQAHQVRANAATNLPPGEFIRTISPTELQLEWHPARPAQGGIVSRRAAIRNGGEAR
jgi:hypothetical protein